MTDSCKKPCPGYSIGNKGCFYMGQWFPIGGIMDIDAKKCLYIRCCPFYDKGCQLTTAVIDSVGERCNCCELDGVLYNQGDVITLPNCERRRCRRGQWQVLGGPPSQPVCPADAVSFEDSCVIAESHWLNNAEAAELCKSKGGSLLELDAEALASDAVQKLRKKLYPCGGVWLGSVEPEEELCGSLPPGADAEILLSCQMRLKPVCVIPKITCGQEFCQVDGQKYDNGAEIKQIDQCTAIVCKDGFPVTVIDETCCRVEGVDGIDLVPSGTNVMIGDKMCTCREGAVDCCGGLPLCKLPGKEAEPEIPDTPEDAEG
ncbi:uncharacterized protein LOC122370755 [Amphibalanus amphitrite]|uniref:uncharacterized protein LOC122370755 n=1 Tax=Amphibalanus amphitrite TaxID=1232801 RepID=UPI001C920E92|nr:uncharacterized protein LOC122370755 [Amphibalanus amphitrite]